MPPDVIHNQGPHEPGGRRFCRRCADMREVTRPWRGWGLMYRIWLGLCATFVIFAPVFAADMFIAYPIAATIVVGGAPLKHYAEQVPRCRYCKLHLPDEPRVPWRQRIRARFGRS